MEQNKTESTTISGKNEAKINIKNIKKKWEKETIRNAWMNEIFIWLLLKC